MWKKAMALCIALVLTVGAAGCGAAGAGNARAAGAGSTQADGQAQTGSTLAEAAVTGETGAAGETGSEMAAAGATQAAADPAGALSTQESAAAGTTGAETAAVSRGLIVIDPGHQQYANTEQEPVGPGASETKIKVSGGTSGVSTGVPEYQLTLEMGLRLRDELEGRGYRVIMVRETNEIDISNSERAAIANEADADAFIRLHANGGGSGATGAMTICQTPDNPYNGGLYADSRALADCVLDAYTEKTGIRYEYVWETDSMSGINWCQVPVTILEMGYMTNSTEDQWMQEEENQVKMSQGIADGIDAFMADRKPKHPEADGEGGRVPLSTEMKELKEKLSEELEKKDGDWSLYLCRMDTGEEIGIHDSDEMISASLIKLYIAGCYLEQVQKGEIPDDYRSQLSVMLSASDNDAANTLIDVLGMDKINAFMEEHGYKEGHLNRKMLQNNGTENYTSARDCGRVLASVYEGTFVSEEGSKSVTEALAAQIARNRYKIPAGVPLDVETANKTGELITNNADGVRVNVQNDAAIIYAKDHPYVLVVMSAVPGAGEGDLHSQIAELSSQIYSMVGAGTETEAETGAEAETGSEAGTDSGAEKAPASGTETGADAKKEGSDSKTESGTEAGTDSGAEKAGTGAET